MVDPVKVAIQFKSRVKREKEPVDQTDQNLKGVWQEKGGSFYLTYKEQHPDLGESTHILKLAEDHVLIMRKGPVSMRLPLISGQKTSGEYQSPAGPFLMEAETEQCDLKWENGMGRIKLIYRLHLQNEYVGKFTLEFKLEAI